MKIKSLLLAAGFFAVAALFTFCTKEELPTTPTANQGSEPVTERGICNVTVQVFNGSLDLCGTQANLVNCATIGTANLFGDGFIPNNGTATYTMTTPTILRLKRNPNFPSAAASMVALVSTPAGVKKIFIPANQAWVNVQIDDACNVI